MHFLIHLSLFLSLSLSPSLSFALQSRFSWSFSGFIFGHKKIQLGGRKNGERPEEKEVTNDWSEDGRSTHIIIIIIIIIILVIIIGFCRIGKGELVKIQKRKAVFVFLICDGLASTDCQSGVALALAYDDAWWWCMAGDGRETLYGNGGPPSTSFSFPFISRKGPKCKGASKRTYIISRRKGLSLKWAYRFHFNLIWVIFAFFLKYVRDSTDSLTPSKC